MEFDINKIRETILDGKPVFGEATEQEVCSGEIIHKELGTLNYQVTNGCNINKAFLCQLDWRKFTTSVFEFIQQQNYSEQELEEILSSLSIEDSHWDWFMKAQIYQSSNYEWFFLTIEDEIQGLCIIKHPCDSKLNTNKIFYIEYIATAPWNRNNPYQEKKYSKVGSKLILCILAFAVDQLDLECGCSLHSLPKAEGFYDNLGMQKIDGHAKEHMKFFELPEDKALKLIGRI